jgi:hypothetical protein
MQTLDLGRDLGDIALASLFKLILTTLFIIPMRIPTLIINITSCEVSISPRHA